MLKKLKKFSLRNYYYFSKRFFKYNLNLNFDFLSRVFRQSTGHSLHPFLSANIMKYIPNLWRNLEEGKEFRKKAREAMISFFRLLLSSLTPSLPPLLSFLLLQLVLLRPL